MSSREHKFIRADGVTARRVARGELEGKRLGGQWYVSEEDLYFKSKTLPPARVSFAPARVLISLCGVLIFISIASAAISSMPAGRGQVAALDATYFEDLPSTLAEAFSSFWRDIPGSLAFLRDKITTNWQNFLGWGGGSGDVPKDNFTSMSQVAASTTLNAAQQAEAVRKIVDEEFKKRFQFLVNQGGEVVSNRGNGLVVFPSTGSAENDRAIKQHVQDLFSDRVMIKFDISGTSGVITPVFRNIPAENYVFMITSVPKSE